MSIQENEELTKDEVLEDKASKSADEEEAAQEDAQAAGEDFGLAQDPSDAGTDQQDDAKTGASAKETDTSEDEPGETADGSSGAEASQEEPASEEKKGFFSRRNKKDKKDQQIEELTDRVKRQMAEFDNYRKRTEKEKAAMFEVGAKSVIEKILPVLDNFERGLAAVPEGCEDPYVEGMEKIYKQLWSTLESLDVKPIDAVGKEFDPEFHNAVMHVEDESLGENIVAEELQKGYLYRDGVVRHSMVKVAN